MAQLLAKFEKHARLTLLVAGGLSATGFAPLGWWPLTLLCLALLMHLVASAQSGKRALLLGWLFGVGHFSIGNNWIATAFTYQAAMPAWLGWIAVFLLALYLAVYPALACWGAWRLGNPPHSWGGGAREARDGGGSPASAASKDTAPPSISGCPSSPPAEVISLPFILAFAGCWIVAEWLRSWLFTGFAWNPLSTVWLDTLFVPLWLPVTGTYGASGMVILACGLIASIPAWFARHRGRGAFGKSGSWIAAAFLAVFVLPVLAVSLFPSLIAQDLPRAENGQPALTVVQPNISQIDKYNPGYDAINFARLAQHSQPKDESPRLILWPEAAIPWRLEQGYPSRFYQFQPGGTPQGARLALMRLMNPGDVLLTGVDRLEFDADRQLVGARNGVTAMDSSGKLLAAYDKAHLVPYGEYLALRWLLEPLGATRLVPGAIDFWPGPGPRTLDLPFDGRRVQVGMQICYEIVFSGQVTDRAHRPDFLFNPSNDAWFGRWGPPQHLAQARLRAIEEGLPVVRATPTGISAVIDADGRIAESLPLGTAGRIDARLPMAKPPTLFALYGNALPLALALLFIAFAVLPLARRRFSR